MKAAASDLGLVIPAATIVSYILTHTPGCQLYLCALHPSPSPPLASQAANCVWALGTLHGKLGVRVTEVGLSPEERRQRRPLRKASSDPTGADAASPSRPAEKAAAIAAGRGDAAWRDSLEGMQVLKGGV